MPTCMPRPVTSLMQGTLLRIKTSSWNFVSAYCCMKFKCVEYGYNGHCVWRGQSYHLCNTVHTVLINNIINIISLSQTMLQIINFESTIKKQH